MVTGTEASPATVSTWRHRVARRDRGADYQDEQARSTPPAVGPDSGEDGDEHLGERPWRRRHPAADQDRDDRPRRRSTRPVATSRPPSARNSANVRRRSLDPTPAAGPRARGERGALGGDVGQTIGVPDGAQEPVVVDVLPVSPATTPAPAMIVGIWLAEPFAPCRATACGAASADADAASAASVASAPSGVRSQGRRI